MTAWPASLPSPGSALMAAHAKAARDSMIRSGVSHGVAKARRRYSSRVTEFPVEMVLTGTQAQTLEAFVDGTVKQVLPFDFEHPITDAAVTVRFVVLPSYELLVGGPIASRKWRVQFFLEIVT